MANINVSNSPHVVQVILDEDVKKDTRLMGSENGHLVKHDPSIKLGYVFVAGEDLTKGERYLAVGLNDGKIFQNADDAILFLARW